VRNFLFNSKNINRSAYLWSTAGGLIFAVQSVVMMIIVSYVIDVQAAGVLAIAYANGNFLQFIGMWGMKQYQVSDVHNKYSFADYKNSRIISCGIMILVAVVVVAYLRISNDYTVEKVLIVSFMCAFKLLDTIEDVFIRHYQKNGRLDVGAKCLTLRIGMSTIVFVVLVFFSKQVLMPIIMVTLFSVVLMVYFIKITLPDFTEQVDKTHKKFQAKKIFALLVSCLPIFLSVFFQNYIANAPRYAIDSLMNDEAQAYFGFLFSPVFVIGLLAGFIFNPILLNMSLLWYNHERKAFSHRIRKQILYIFLITLGTVVVGYFIGLKVLSVLYNANLTGFTYEFVVLLISGGFLAVSSLCIILLTIIRKQVYVLVVYSIAAICAMLLFPIAVEHSGINGAVLTYALITFATSIFMLCILIFNLLRSKSPSPTNQVQL
jgi:O-antigen/teichoic acid export membrane protein